MVHTRLAEITALCQITHTRKATRLFVNSAADFKRAWNGHARFNQGFARNDACGQSTLHVASATAINFAVANFCAEGVGGPATASFHHIDVAIEVHALAGAGTLPTRHHIHAWLGI